MNTFRFSESQQELLSVIMIEHIMEMAVSMRPQDAEQRAAFADMAAIVAELHSPTPQVTINDPLPPIGDSILENGFDPRARNPHCVHGLSFSESCEQCAKNWTDTRLHDTRLGLNAYGEAQKLTGVNGDGA